MSACRWFVPALVLAAFVRPAPAQQPPQPTPELLPLVIHRDVTFATIDGQKLQLDIVRPKAPGPYPGVVVLHGGAWKVGNRKDVASFAESLAAHGYVVASVSYRLAPKAKFPAQIEDVRTAVRFLRANAREYDIDPKRFAATGFSAGGHLSLLLGTADKSAGLDGTLYPDQDGRVQCVASYFGPTDLSLYAATEGLEDAFMVPLLGKEVKTDRTLYKKASPIDYVTKDDPPVLMFHGTFDFVVPIVHSERMLTKLKEAGVPAELVKFPGEGHGFTRPVMTKCVADTVRFFDTHLKGKK